MKGIQKKKKIKFDISFTFLRINVDREANEWKRVRQTREECVLIDRHRLTMHRFENKAQNLVLCVNL